MKPFAFVELLARVRVLLRRGQPTPERLQVGDLSLDCIRRKVTRAGENVELAPKEFSILEYLMRNRGRPLSRTMIVEHVWDMDYDGLTNIVDVYIRHLRSKIDDKWPQKMIQTVRGIGYMLDLPEKGGKSDVNGAVHASLRRCRKLPVHFARGLRFRLTLSYVVLFTALLVVIGLFFRQTLASQTGKFQFAPPWKKNGARRRAICKIENQRPLWIADPSDPEEAYIVSRIKRVFLITDANGTWCGFRDTTNRSAGFAGGDPRL